MKTSGKKHDNILIVTRDLLSLCFVRHDSSSSEKVENSENEDENAIMADSRIGSIIVTQKFVLNGENQQPCIQRHLHYPNKYLCSFHQGS